MTLPSQLHRRLPRLVPLVALCLPFPGLAGAPDGHWRGELEFRGDSMAVELRIGPGPGGPSVLLDIPSLLMAREPVPAQPSASGLSVELPFGLGPISFAPDGDRAAGRKPLGDDELEWAFERSPPPALRFEDVGFHSGGARLAGTLVVPEGPGPHPAVVLVHGSAAGTRARWAYRSWADFFAGLGVAALAYDRRGEGASGGEANASLDTLADDAAAAVAWLRARPDVDAGRVGLKGGSQGAWIAEAAAARAGNVDFLVLTSAPAGTPREQHLQQLAYGMRADGRPEDEVQDALAYAGLYFYVARTGRGWKTLEDEVARARAAPWGEYVDQPRSPEDLRWWSENHDFQTMPVLARLHMPVLLLYGADDWIVPPVENAALLKSRFGSPALVSVRVFDRADHRLEVPAGTDSSGRWRWPRVAEGVIPAIAGWLDAAIDAGTAPGEAAAPPID